MKAAGYVRVSTGKQAEEGLSLEEQQRRIRAYADSQGWEMGEMFIEAGASAWKEDAPRPRLDALLEQIDDYGAVIVPKLDRFGRRASRLLELYDFLEQRGSRLVVLSPHTLDTSTPAGRLLRTVLAGVAEYESDNTSERVKSVQGARARAGNFIGSHTPYGWTRRDKSDKGKPTGPLVPHKVESVIVKRIFEEWAVGGMSQKAIARALNEAGVKTKRGASWSQARVRQVLTNPTHIGKVLLHGELYDGAHEPLIPAALWEKAQARLGTGNGRGRGRSPKGQHLFTRGLLRCAHCGYAMAPRTDSQGRESYVCLGRQNHGAGFCPMNQVPRVAVDESAFSYFEHVALDVEVAQAELEVQLKARRTEARVLMEDAKRDVGEWEARKERADLDYLDRKIEADEWRAQLEKINTSLEEARRRLAIVTDRVLELHPDDDLTQRARDEVLRRIAELRQAVAGEVSSAEGLEQVRAQLGRLFERFDIGRTDLEADPDMPPEMAEERAQALQEARSEPLAIGDWVVLPWARPGVAEPLSEEWRPPLGLSDRTRLSRSDKNTRSGSSTGISWPAFGVPKPRP